MPGEILYCGRLYSTFEPTPRALQREYISCTQTAILQRGKQQCDSGVHPDIAHFPVLTFRNGDDSVPGIDKFPLHTARTVLLAAPHSGVQGDIKFWQMLGAVALDDSAQSSLFAVAQPPDARIIFFLLTHESGRVV